VSIRTSIVHGTLDGPCITGTLHYGTGGGITAQSDPDAEVHETVIKAQALRRSLTAAVAG
jgi:anthranilate/para-aminobenzoate synthase component I